MGSSWDSALPAEYPGVSSHSSLQGVAYPVNHLSLFCPAKRNHASAAVRENGATSPGVYELSRNPSTNREDKKRIERVHRKATKLFTSIRNRPYEGRLRLLDLPSLYHRRRRGDMITVYQVLTVEAGIRPGGWRLRSSSLLLRLVTPADFSGSC